MKFISILLLFITTAWLAACSHESKHEAHVGRVYDSLSGSLPLDPLNGQVITSLINKKNDTMAVLYGNDTAVAFARTNHSGIYPSGARLYLLTWQEKEDAYWFGARV
ncbi:MAG TPA: hypothetical protein VIN08_28065, partial [Ohtaekwangia sp.]|uniref:hypothetical protein n=1 Tax=Ohtaekwangia sp. TaxID=2066019 RepID=UPI002FB2A79D